MFLKQCKHVAKTFFLGYREIILPDVQVKCQLPPGLSEVHLLNPPGLAQHSTNLGGGLKNQP